MRCTGGPVHGPTEIEFRIVCRGPQKTVVGVIEHGIVLRTAETRVFDKWGQLLQSRRRLFLSPKNAITYLQGQVKGTTQREFSGRRRR
jgi:hypothetical protein